MNRHLNYFYPYTSTASHENQLTRSFLALARLIPAVRQLFLEYIRESQESECECPLPSFYELAQADLDTQRGNLPAAGWDKLIAVLMTTENVMPSEVRERDGGAVYDGVILTPPYVITIENKPKYAGGQNQLHPCLPPLDGDERLIDPAGVVIVWDELLAKVIWLLDSPLLGFAEKILVGDFLDLVQSEFPQLSPFSTYAICGRRHEPLDRRSSAILEEITPGRVRYSSYAYYSPLRSEVAIRAYLGGYPADGAASEISLDIYPGDLTTQATVFFDRAKDAALSALVADGWKLRPSFHFSQQGNHLNYVESALGPFEYLAYWRDNRDAFRQLKRDESLGEDRFQQWIAAGVFAPTQMDELKLQFQTTNRTALNICPGFKLTFSWPIAEAEQLDRDGLFVQAVKDRIAQALPAWGDSIEAALAGDAG